MRRFDRGNRGRAAGEGGGAGGVQPIRKGRHSNLATYVIHANCYDTLSTGVIYPQTRSNSLRYILARHTRRSHTDCNPGARAYAHLAGPRHEGGTDWHAHVPQRWPMVLCTLPPHVGKPLPTYVGPAFPGASSCLKHPTDRQACLCRVADRRLVVTGSALLDAHVSLPRWWRVSYAPARPTQDGAGPRRRPSACPCRASAEIPVSQHC